MSVQRIIDWMASRRWQPFDYQRDAWQAYLAGRSGLIHAPTGMGKTYAAWLGPMAEYLAGGGATGPRKTAEAIRVLWITPLRALAADIADALRQPVADLDLPWTVELRTGDVSSTIKTRQRKRLPTALVTTPESLSLLLSYPEARQRFATLRAVVVDEWHELMSTKRGTQTELGLARLRAFNPQLRTCGLSATLGNLKEAQQALLGMGPHEAEPYLIHGPGGKRIDVRTLIPERIERFPWYGHLGVKLRGAVAEAIDAARSTLLFTNTRSQAELWFAGLLEERPDWVGKIALHHGSLDRKLRRDVETKVNAGELKAVVCTSSLDLGVDFTPVDQVMQVGSPKGIARLMQRAGRSGHQPGAASRVVCVPTHAFELVEFAAAGQAIGQRDIEARPPIRLAMDVLAQHLVTVATGEGFDVDALRAEVRSTHAYAALGDEQWAWVMAFVTIGGQTLRAYPQFQRVALGEDGRYRIREPRLARLHRLAIGTITDSTAMRVRYRNGKTLGTIEESFIARLKPGDSFIYAGRKLELLRVEQMNAYVKRSTRQPRTVPRWEGARFPLSTQLADYVLREIRGAAAGDWSTPEMRAIRPLLELQQRHSQLPGPDRLLVERTRTREGHHVFLYPFAGRLVNEGLGALLAHRLTAERPRSITATANDYGIELLCPDPIAADEADLRRWFTTENLLDDLLACVNATQMARRAFRDIARIAGLIHTGYPGQSKPVRHLQASSELFFEVFSEFDPQHLLLEQARREVLEQQLEYQRLDEVMRRVAAMPMDVIATERLTPLAFPLYADRLRSQEVSTEAWHQRVARIAARLEEDATMVS